MKIDLTTEILKHPDQEVIEFLTEELNGVVKVFSDHDNPTQLEVCAKSIGIVYNVLKEMNKRNKQKTGQDDAVVL